MNNPTTLLSTLRRWPAASLIVNMLTVFVLFTMTRLVFVASNWGMFAEYMSAGYMMRLLLAGLRFDCTAILYLNCWMIVAFLLPLPRRLTTRGYFKTLRIVYVVVNFIGLAANLCDCAYFPFTGRRTTWSVLAEFGGEGNLATILLHEGLAYWPLFIVGIASAWGLYRAFTTPLNPPERGEANTTASESASNAGKTAAPRSGISAKAYYVGQCVSLALAVGLTIGGMRGGFTKAVRPITMSNANLYVTHSIDTGIVLNTPFCILRTIGKEPFAEVHFMDDAEAQRLYSPLHTPADSTEFKAENVVVIILESFGKEGQARGFMPFLDSLAHEGLSFEHSFACGRKSIDGMPSVLSSIPSFVEPFFLTSGSLNTLSGIAGELTRHKGYASAFFHGAENGSMGFSAFAHATGFEHYYGRTEYCADANYGGDADFDGTWAIWDEEFLQFFADHMDDHGEPFVASVFTASSHSPFRIPEKHREHYAVTDPPLYGCIRYSDDALRKFFDKAKTQPWFERTIFVLTADHTSEPTLPEYTSDLGRYRVPIVLYAPGHPELHGVDHERTTSQADIMPTVLGLLGYDRPYVAFGQDVLRTPADKTLAVNYLPGSDYYQYIQGDWMLQFDGQKVVHAYRYKDDATLQHDLQGKHPAEYERRLKSIIQQYMYRMLHNEMTAD